ncbi:MAG: alpha/beta fold hydrolase [Candidatus Kariarchaeaceae archaeon]|jgi:pimeloyl-ACP methyl ester carboxylesterase
MRTQFKGKYISINGMKMYYFETGIGHPTILIHGGAGTGEMNWANLIRLLENDYRLIVPDSRGHGRSDNPLRKLGYKIMAEDYIQLIRDLGLQKPNIIGFSDGAEIALYLGSKYSDEIGSLVVTGAVADLGEDWKLVMKNEWGILGPGKVDFDLLRKAFGSYLDVMKKEFSYVYGENYWKEYFEIVSEFWWDSTEYLTDEDIKNIQVPTLVMQGDRDPGCSVERAVQIYRLISNAELAIAPNSNHGYPITKTELFYDLIKNFLLTQTVSKDKFQ